MNTTESKEGRQLHFSDVLVMKNHDRRLGHEAYCMPTHTNLRASIAQSRSWAEVCGHENSKWAGLMNLQPTVSLEKLKYFDTAL